MTDTICFREFLECPQQVPQNIAESKFNVTLIAGNPYRELVTRHFEQYPVLYMDLKVNCIVYMPELRAEQSKNVQGFTFEGMLKSFDRVLYKELRKRAGLFRDSTLDPLYTRWYELVSKDPKPQRETAFKTLSEALRVAYNRRVVVLIDEYDSPMHCAIENGYADLVWSFVFSPFV